MNKRISKPNKRFTPSKGSRIILTRNKIKDFVKLTKSLENRGILLKGITEKVITKEDFLDK